MCPFSLDVPLLGEIALRPEITSGGDRGEPAVLHEGGDGPFTKLARRILHEVAP